MFLDGFKYWVLPDDAPAEQAARYISDSWEARVERWVAGKFRQDREGNALTSPRLRWDEGRAVEWTTTDELLEYAIGMDPAKHTKADQMRIASIMKRLGTDPIRGDTVAEDTWEHRRQRWPEGGREWRWVRVRADSGGGPPPPVPRASSGGDDEPDF